MTLAEFLLARVAEDAAIAQAAAHDGYGAIDWAGESGPTDTHIARHDPARVLAECEAKRSIVEFHSEPLSWMDSPTASPRLICILCGTDDITWPCRTLRALALPYADHPDYDPTWVPSA